jgi:hypothetical protein
MAAVEGFMGVAAISAAVATGGDVAVGVGAAAVMGGEGVGTEVVRIGMVVLPIGGGITHTLMGVMAAKRLLGVGDADIAAAGGRAADQNGRNELRSSGVVGWSPRLLLSDTADRPGTPWVIRGSRLLFHTLWRHERAS